MAVSDLIIAFQSELKKKPLLRLGLAGLIVIIAGFVYDTIQTYRVESYTAYSDKFRHTKELLQLSKENFWEKRQTETQTFLSTLEARLWPSQNEGLARANLQKELTQICEKSGVDKPKITLEQPRMARHMIGFKKFTAIIQAFSKAEAIEQLFINLQKQERAYMIQELELRLKPGGFFRMAVAVYMPEIAQKGNK
jgi:hypothetical protein